jgi:hypothetical protein
MRAGAFGLWCPVLVLWGVSAAAAPPATLKPGAYPQRRSDRYTLRDGLPGKRVTAIKRDGGAVVVETELGQATFADGRWKTLESNRQVSFAPPAVDRAKLPAGVKVLRAAQGPDKRLWIVTDRGAFRSEGGAYVPVTPPQVYLTQQPAVNVDALITDVAVDSLGQVWFGTIGGIYATDGANFWNPFDRRNGLPCEYVTCLAFGPDGELWAGTAEGVCRYTAQGAWQYYRGPRWLPDNHVNAIAVGSDGAAWVATDGGVARLYDAKTTLAQKAAHYEEITAARHNRRGFVTGGTLKKPGDVTGGIIHEASDNDGLWTAVYVGAESFRYAATKDPQARALAHRSMWAMLDLMKYTGIPGFPARAIVTPGEEVTGVDRNETVRIPGETDKIWFPSPIDSNVLCKGDTSSDETDGHYFAWLVYHDLVADAAEKKAIADAVRAITDNILNHDLFLVGPTGRRTLWGVWNPKFLNDDPQWWEERGLNALEILAYLKIADHICGDPKYRAKYMELIQKHHYLLNTVYEKVAEPWYGVNHSDDQMAFMMYYALMTLEKDSDIRRVLLQSMERSWKVERPEHSPFFNFVYGVTTGHACDVEASVATLQDWPWELIDWQVDNSRRMDVTFRSVPWESRTKVETETALPISERPLMRWNGNPYEVSGGSMEGRNEEDGSAWLLPYYMGRYYGLIAEEGKGT